MKPEMRFLRNYFNSILPSWHPDETGAKELEQIAGKIKRKEKIKPMTALSGLVAV